MIKQWLFDKIFFKELKNYYENVKKVIDEKNLEIKNLKERINYLQLEIFEKRKIK